MDIVTHKPLLDWLTLTTFDQETWESFKDNLGDPGQCRFQKRLQYRGLANLAGVFVGTGQQKQMDHGMIQVSGPGANETGQVLRGADRVRCTRIDIQITVPGKLDAIGAGLDIRSEFGNRVSVDILSGNTGDTLYIGSWKSDRFWRVYQKTETLVRFEVVLKGDNADAAWAMIRIGGNFDQVTAALLVGEISRSKPLSFVPGCSEAHEAALLVSEGCEERVTTSRKESDTVKWLRNSVDPAIYKLLNSHDPDDYNGAIEILNQWIGYAHKAADRLD